MFFLSLFFVLGLLYMISKHRFYMDNSHVIYIEILKGQKFHMEGKMKLIDGDIIHFFNHDTVRHQFITNSENIENTFLLHPNDSDEIRMRTGNHVFSSSLYDMDKLFVTVA